MYHTTGFSKDEILDLCALLYANEENYDIDPWPPSLGLYKSVVIALTYMRRNRVQQELAETYKTSQPTISRANSRITSRLAIVLAPFVPTAEDLDPGTQYIYDGTLLPCWSWREHRELYSGKHKTTGKRVQVACNLYGRLRGYPTRSTGAAMTRIASTNHRCSSGFLREARWVIRDTSAKV
jgi:hypothetical protein